MLCVLRSRVREEWIVRDFGCDAILFDLDGVLVDSTAVVVRTWRNWAGSRGLDAQSILEVAHGRRTAETIRLVAPHLDADSEAEDLERVAEGDLDGILEIEKARELLASLPQNSWAVVTSGARALATRRMEHTGLPLPDAFVTAEDVTHGKPHPEAYLRGAELLGARPEACVVIEDAPSGIRAAKSAGMRVVAVTTTYRREELSEADEVVESLALIRTAVSRAELSADAGSRLTLRM